MKKIFTYLFAIIFCGNIIAQCPQGDILLVSQQEVNDFALTYPGCVELPGSLTINSSFGDIEDLSGLIDITNISGDLIIELNDSLETFTGLDNLSTVSGDLAICSNGVTSLSALNNITTIGGSLLIINNDDLLTLAGLEGLENIGEDLTMFINGDLISLAGLDNVTNIGGSVTIEHNFDLSFCGVFSLCNYLENGGSATIEGNAAGCENIVEVQEDCLPCPPSHVMLTSQQEVNDFLVNYPDCTRINGNLWIWSPAYGVNTNISDLTPLNQLETIERSLEIRRNGPLTDMTGLENLDSIGLALIIKDNPSLTNLSGLQNLVHVQEELRVDNCNNIKTLTGLEGITRLESLVIIYNNKLDSLSGLEQLERVENMAWISTNGIVSLAGLENLQYVGTMIIEILPKLTDFRALSSLDTVPYFVIYDVDKPTDLQGLENLNYIDERLSLGGNLRLQNLDALSNLDTLAGAVFLVDNANLTSIEGLSTINSDSILYLSIKDNPKLSVCHIESVCTYLSNNGENTISNNKAGCMNTAEVLDACVVSVENTNYPTSFSISPNPSKGIFQVNGIPQGIYQIHDTKGRIIQNGNMKNDLSINISKEAQGVYFISIQMDNEVITKRIIKL